MVIGAKNMLETPVYGYNPYMFNMLSVTSGMLTGRFEPERTSSITVTSPLKGSPVKELRGVTRPVGKTVILSVKVPISLAVTKTSTY
jgi:hypothetical protein